MSKPDRDSETNYAVGARPCPGYRRPCGVNTVRPLCQFCTRAREMSNR